MMNEAIGKSDLKVKLSNRTVFFTTTLLVGGTIWFYLFNMWIRSDVKIWEENNFKVILVIPGFISLNEEEIIWFSIYNKSNHKMDINISMTDDGNPVKLLNRGESSKEYLGKLERNEQMSHKMTVFLPIQVLEFSSKPAEFLIHLKLKNEDGVYKKNISLKVSPIPRYRQIFASLGVILIPIIGWVGKQYFQGEQKNENL
jgi:hypothetical protein